MELEKALQHLYQLTLIPLAVYEDGACVFSVPVQVQPQNLAYYLLHGTAADHRVQYLLYRKSTECACVQLEPADGRQRLLVLGPCRGVETADARQTHQGGTVFFTALQLMADLFCPGQEIDLLFRDDCLDSSGPVSAEETEHQDREKLRTSRYVEDWIPALIREGRPEEIAASLSQISAMKMAEGHMADSALRNFKDVLIVSAAISRHTAIQAGVNVDLANALCDQHIRQVEKETDLHALERLLRQILVDYAVQVQKLHSSDRTDPVVRLVCSDVNAHLYEKLSLSVIAGRLDYAPSYLSRLFHRQTGKTIGAYIRQEKIEEAKKLLLYTNLSLNEIAGSLCYASQSHFQLVFSESCGETPQHYRRNHRV